MLNNIDDSELILNPAWDMHHVRIYGTLFMRLMPSSALISTHFSYRLDIHLNHAFHARSQGSVLQPPPINNERVAVGVDLAAHREVWVGRGCVLNDLTVTSFVQSRTESVIGDFVLRFFLVDCS
jgi:hypothetical protein